jgi:hypothetical protein
VPLLATYLGFGRRRTWAAVNQLVDVSLARRVPGTSAYKLHDLTFSYARMLGGECAVKAVAEFARVHGRDHAVLEADMDNLLGAAAAARESDPDAFLSIVETLAVDGYLDNHGHTLACCACSSSPRPRPRRAGPMSHPADEARQRPLQRGRTGRRPPGLHGSPRPCAEPDAAGRAAQLARKGRRRGG